MLNLPHTLLVCVCVCQLNDPMELVTGNGVESRELADLKMSRRDAFASRVMTVDSNDNELKNKIESGTILTLPMIITGESKTGTQVKGIFPDLVAMASLAQNGDVYSEGGKHGYTVVLDLRKKEEIRADDEAGLKTDMIHIHDAADVRDTTDTLSEVKRVRFRFMSFETIKLNNNADVRDFRPGTFAIVRIEPRAWRDDNKKIAVMFKLMGVVHQHPLPVHRFVQFAWEASSPTLRFKTAVFEFREDMRRLTAKYGGSIPKNDEMAAQYRNDNELMIFTGFNHGQFLDKTLDLKSGACYRDKTVDDPKFFKGYSKALKKDELRYMAEFKGEQWEDSPAGYPIDEPDRVMQFILKVPFWTETVSRFQITSLSAWTRIAPVNMPYLQALVLGRENAKSTFENGLTSNRVQQVDDGSGLPTYELASRINKPASNSRVSFVLSTNVDAVLCDEVKFIETVGVLVPATLVKTILFDNKTTPKYPADVSGAPVLDLSKPLICLSELKVDVKRVLDNPDYEFRVITSARALEPSFSQDMLGRLPIEEGSQLVTYLATTLGKRLQTTRDDYLRIKKIQVADQHILKRFNFQFSGEELYLYVFAVNKKIAREEEDSFIEFIHSIKGVKRHAFSSFLTAAPGGPSVESEEENSEESNAPEPEPEVKKKSKKSEKPEKEAKKPEKEAKKPEKEAKKSSKESKRKESIAEEAGPSDDEKPALKAEKKGTKRKAAESVDTEPAPVSEDKMDVEGGEPLSEPVPAADDDDATPPPPPKKVAKLSSILNEYEDEGADENLEGASEKVQSPPTSPKHNGSNKTKKSSKKSASKKVPEDDMSNPDFDD